MLAQCEKPWHSQREKSCISARAYERKRGRERIDSVSCCLRVRPQVYATIRAQRDFSSLATYRLAFSRRLKLPCCTTTSTPLIPRVCQCIVAASAEKTPWATLPPLFFAIPTFTLLMQPHLFTFLSNYHYFNDQKVKHHLLFFR